MTLSEPVHEWLPPHRTAPVPKYGLPPMRKRYVVPCGTACRVRQEGTGGAWRRHRTQVTLVLDDAPTESPGEYEWIVDGWRMSVRKNQVQIQRSDA